MKKPEEWPSWVQFRKKIQASRCLGLYCNEAREVLMDNFPRTHWHSRLLESCILYHEPCTRSAFKSNSRMESITILIGAFQRDQVKDGERKARVRTHFNCHQKNFMIAGTDRREVQQVQSGHCFHVDQKKALEQIRGNCSCCVFVLQ